MKEMLLMTPTIGLDQFIKNKSNFSPYMFLHLTLLLTLELTVPQILLKHAGQNTFKVNQDCTIIKLEI
jgi:hypothetical protein